MICDPEVWKVIMSSGNGICPDSVLLSDEAAAYTADANAQSFPEDHTPGGIKVGRQMGVSRVA